LGLVSTESEGPGSGFVGEGIERNERRVDARSGGSGRKRVCCDGTQSVRRFS